MLHLKDGMDLLSWATSYSLSSGVMPEQTPGRGGAAGRPFEELSEQCIGLLRAVCDQEPGPFEVVRIRLEEVRKLIKLDQLARNWFCRSNLFLVKD